MATKKLDYSCLFFYHLFIIYSWFKLSLSMFVIWISIDICKIFLLWEIMYYFQCHLFLALLWETKYVSLIIIVGTVVTHGYFTSTCTSPVHLVKKDCWQNLLFSRLYLHAGSAGACRPACNLTCDSIPLVIP